MSSVNGALESELSKTTYWGKVEAMVVDQMVLTHGSNGDNDVERESNRTLLSALARAYR